MNYFEPFYAALCYARKKNGEPFEDSPLTGNVLLTLSLFVLSASIITTLFFLFPSFGQTIFDFVENTFGKDAGHMTGKILAILGILMFYPIARYTVGTDANFQKIMARCETMSLDELKTLSRKGGKTYASMMASMLIPLFIYWMKFN